jgi:hypothetical protein
MKINFIKIGLLLLCVIAFFVIYPWVFNHVNPFIGIVVMILIPLIAIQQRHSIIKWLKSSKKKPKK